MSGNGVVVRFHPTRLICAVVAAVMGVFVAGEFVAAVHQGHPFGIALDAFCLFMEGAIFGWAASGAVRRT